MFESKNQYDEIEFVCHNSEYHESESTDKQKQKQLYGELLKLKEEKYKGKIFPYMQNFSDEKHEQYSLAVIILDRENQAGIKKEIKIIAKNLGVKIDLINKRTDNQVDRIITGRYQNIYNPFQDQQQKINLSELRKFIRRIIKESQENVPQSGDSSGAPAEFKVGTKPENVRLMTLDQILKHNFDLHPNGVKGVPKMYFKGVVEDFDNKDFSWPTSKKVLEYAKYLLKNPDSFENLPPMIVINNIFQDGAHRVSTIYLINKRLNELIEYIEKNDYLEKINSYIPPKSKDPIYWKNLRFKVQFWDGRNEVSGYWDPDSPNYLDKQK